MENSDVNNLGLSTEYTIRCIGFGGLSLKRRKQLHSVDLKLYGVDLVIVELGSNDLCDQDCDSAKLARDLFSYATFLHEGLGVKAVAISQILYRVKVPFKSYHEKVVEINSALHSLAKNSSLPIVFWRHRGMWKCEESVIGRDGVHLSCEVGYPKYLRSMRDCVVRVSKWFE